MQPASFQLEQFFNRPGHGPALRLDEAGVAADEPAFAVNQVFVKVPARGASDRGKCKIKRVSILTFDPGLGVHRELHIVGQLTEVLDTLFIAGLLTAKVVGGKSHHHQTFGAIL